MRTRSLIGAAAVLVAMYFCTGIYLLRFRLELFLLPHTDAPTSPSAPPLQSIDGRADTFLVRRYGEPREGCVLFFPGQHGELRAYETQLFPAFTNRGIAVLAVAYPGQDGAPGAPNLEQIQALGMRTVAAASAVCGERRVVLYGRSLGSMVAAYSAADHQPAGLILEGAAPSLASAIRSRLKAHWYLAPLAALPISTLLAHDFSLEEALSQTRLTQAVDFQGTADSETPLSTLRSAPGLGKLHIIEVPGGTHSTTYRLAEHQIVETAVSMLRQQHT